MSLDTITSESAMDYACRPSNQPFLDLRSAHKARNRARSKMEKYNHFRRPGLTRGDLPSFQGQQQPHYLPVCYLPECPTRGTADGCWLSLFPADLSTAPIAKFTKREAYQDAQLWPRPPTYHRSGGRRRGSTMTSKHTKYARKVVDKELRARDWYDDIEYFKWEEDMYKDMHIFERYCYFGQHADYFESEEDDVRNGISDPTDFADVDNELDEGYGSSAEAEAKPKTMSNSPSDTQPAPDIPHRWPCTTDGTVATCADHTTGAEKSWFWHRNFAGGWYRAGFKEHCWHTCACENQWCAEYFCNGEYWDDRPRTVFSLGEWLEGPPDPACQPTEALSEVTCAEDSQESWGWASKPLNHSGNSQKYAESDTGDWDMLSNSSEAWTEVEELASSTDSMGC